MRILNLLVIMLLVGAAAYVYEIKFESTLQAERLAKLRSEIRRERDAVSALRAEWAKLDNPGRIEGIAKRHLALRPALPTQIDDFSKLPERPIPIVPPGTDDPIGAIIEQSADDPASTGSVGEAR